MSPRDQTTTISLELITERANELDSAPVRNVEPPNEIELSRDTMFKLASTGLSFFFSGMNDGSLGALIPYLIRSYNISTDLASIV